MLQWNEHSIAEVAAAVGHGSEAAFNRAFKREFDCPPASFAQRLVLHALYDLRPEGP